MELRKQIEKLSKKLDEAETALADARKEMSELVNLVYRVYNASAEALGMDKDRLHHTYEKDKTPLFQTDLSLKAANKLYRNNIKYLEELSETSRTELLAIRGIGKSTVNEVVKYCREHNITFNEQ